MTLTLRPAHADDLADITALQARFDTHWFGAPERDESEVAEELDHSASSVVVTEDGELVAAAWTDPPRITLTIDPSQAPAPVLATMLSWMLETDGVVDVLSRDEFLRQALLAAGWHHTRSTFELLRTVGADWILEEPVWPAGIRITDFTAATPAQVHNLIYREAGWADVTGHVERRLEDWTALFVTEKDDPAQQVLAWRDDRLVGVATGRIFADGSGWIAQLAGRPRRPPLRARARPAARGVCTTYCGRRPHLGVGRPG